MLTAPDWSRQDRQAVREQLDRILTSGPFAQSRRRQRFLSYIVGEALAGRGERLKGYTIALEVFDRPQSFDPAVDPVVRMEATRLRDRLREYYEGDGRNDPICIALPKGTYAPQIELRPAPVPLQQESSELTPGQPLLAPETTDLARNLRKWRWPLALSAMFLLAGLAAIGTWLHSEPPRAAPTIAVLPFTNMSGDPKQKYFSDGLTEDILTELSRAREIRVLARNATFRYKDKAIDVTELGRELNARYVLEGSIQRSGNNLRITAQLIDAPTGAHVWAERFDRTMADIFLLQDEIVSQIYARIAGSYGAIETTETKTATRRSPNEVQAYDLVLHAREVMRWDWSNANIRSAKLFLNQAIALDPTNAKARAELAWLAVIGRAFRYDKAPMEVQEVMDLATLAIEVDPGNADTHMIAASAYFYSKQLDLFEREANRTLLLAPNDPYFLSVLGYMTALSGNWPRGLEMVTKANALNPDAVVGWYHITLFFHRYLSGDYPGALEIVRQDTNRRAPSLFVAYIPVLGQLGLKDQALENWRKLLAESPNWSAATFESWWRARNLSEQDIAKLMDGVYKSGVLETP